MSSNPPSQNELRTSSYRADWHTPYYGSIQAHVREPRPHNEYYNHLALLHPLAPVLFPISHGVHLHPSVITPREIARFSPRAAGEYINTQKQNTFLTSQWWLLREESDMFREMKEELEDENLVLKMEMRGQDREIAELKRQLGMVSADEATASMRGLALRGSFFEGCMNCEMRVTAGQTVGYITKDHACVLQATRKELEKSKQENEQLKSQISRLEQEKERAEIKVKNMKRKTENKLEQNRDMCKMSFDFAQGRVGNDRPELCRKWNGQQSTSVTGAVSSALQPTDYTNEKKIRHEEREQTQDDSATLASDATEHCTNEQNTGSQEREGTQDDSVTLGSELSSKADINEWDELVEDELHDSDFESDEGCALVS